ncbi:MAG: hypothetical protein AAF960_13980 [Bacteroidota bacterium]
MLTAIATFIGFSYKNISPDFNREYGPDENLEWGTSSLEYV